MGRVLETPFLLDIRVLCSNAFCWEANMALTPSRVDKRVDRADSIAEKGTNFGGSKDAFCSKEGSYDVRDIRFLVPALCVKIVRTI
jgi:hypothetical protein